MPALVSNDAIARVLLLCLSSFGAPSNLHCLCFNIFKSLQLVLGYITCLLQEIFSSNLSSFSQAKLTFYDTVNIT